MKKSLAVIGDVLLDVDVLTNADRLTPDAPVPVLDEVSRRMRPGGAALAALLAARDARLDVVLIAPVADDQAGRQVLDMLTGLVEVVPLPCTGSTPVKTRLRSGGQTVARLDNGGGIAITEIPADARAALRDATGVLVSDYGGASTTDANVRALLTATAQHTPTVWDPHPRGGPPVPGITLVSPNAGEAAAAADQRSGTAADLAGMRRAAETLLARWQARSVVITLGARGALLCFGTGSSELVPAQHTSTQDSCGAGDCFAATAAIELALGGLPSDATARAVASATRFVVAGGVAILDRDARPVTSEAAQPAEALVARVRAQGGVVVATGGCFDLLHAGHVETLAAARSLGDCLIVCLNSDASVRRLKGEPRPLQPQADRVRVLTGLRAVDAVVLFDEDTPIDVLSRLRPDIWVKGGDYTGTRLPETDLIQQWGGEVVTVGYLGGRSTSHLLAQARR